MHAYLLPCLNFGPIIIQRLIEKLPESEYDRPTGEDRFTPREIVAHLADWEPIMRGRVQTAVENPGSMIEAYDEGQMAIDHNYSATDIHEQAALFVAERAKTTAYVESLSPDVLKQTVTHPERGEQSVEDLAGMLLGHDMYHVEQLTR